MSVSFAKFARQVSESFLGERTGFVKAVDSHNKYYGTFSGFSQIFRSHISVLKQHFLGYFSYFAAAR